MKFFHTAFVIVLFFSKTFAQSYTSYFTGDVADVSPTPLGGTCLMGGATENDEAMKWFLERANGGDVLVLRASGSDGYNEYMFSELGVSVNSVETIVFNNSQATSENYVLQQIENAEAIWFAGGDQWDYVSYWRNSAVSEKINYNIQNKNIVIGGTSAGMAILGGIYFTAEQGTIQSNVALNNPYNNNLTISQETFLATPFLPNVITDTHYDNPERKGRHLVFLARAKKDWGIDAKGIACDEYTAVCIDTTGIARVYGEYPTYDDNAYFLQINCVLPNAAETCEANTSLNWVRNNAAVKVYHIQGNPNGNNSFNLNTWEEGNGGTWKNWYVENGTFQSTDGDAINCETTSNENLRTKDVNIFPNPLTTEFLHLESSSHPIEKVEVMDLFGKKILEEKIKQKTYKINFSSFPKGVYFIKVFSENEFFTKKIIW